MKVQAKKILLGVLAAAAMGSATAATFTGTVTRVRIVDDFPIFKLSSGGTFGLDPGTGITPEQIDRMMTFIIEAWGSNKTIIVTNDTGYCLGYCAIAVTTSPAF